MPIRDLLKKKDKVEQHDAPVPEAEVMEEPVFRFYRSDTNTQEMISPPTFSSSETSPPPSVDGNTESRTSRLFKGRHRSSSAVSGASVSSRNSDSKSKSPSGEKKRLSQRLHLRRSEVTSASVPTDLPEITFEGRADGGEVAESQWERRATILAKKNEESRSRPTTPIGSTADLGTFSDMSLGDNLGGRHKSAVSSKLADDNIQEAIRLHEAGDLETSTKMFGRLADPNGENNALSQVLYGLALRYVQWSNSMQPMPGVALEIIKMSVKMNMNMVQTQ
jgi:hypothetical protein